MSIRVVRLGNPRAAGEGLRIGTVRRPPRGVPKNEYSSRDLYDVWLPELAPSEALLKDADAAHDERSWQKFVRRYRIEMSRPEARHLLDVMAALSKQTNFAVGCYCADESHCHRSILRQLLADHGAEIV
ncbi:MAG: DUF488 family protein [Deltaproteobacteria bacterium]|nr:DUF488 family protein [Deltaproteobacteria bacterium]